MSSENVVHQAGVREPLMVGLHYMPVGLYDRLRSRKGE